MKTNNCTCTTTVEVCRTTAGERPRYFPRQLVTAEDMMLEQEYFRNRMRLHNRLLHGWGVVCGLQVAPVAKKDGTGGLEPWKVKICPGAAIGPYGDDIMAPCEVEIDLRQDSISGSSIEPCGAIGDVWCSDVWLDRSEDRILYLAIKYAEVPARPVHVQPAGCGCDDLPCEFSRLLDGYVIKVLTAEEHRPLALDRSKLPDWRALFGIPTASPPQEGSPNPSCWPCPDHPWVTLAGIRVDADGKITLIDNCGPRRLVAALGGFYWSCAKVEIRSVSTLSPPSTFECGRAGRTTITLAREMPNTIIVVGEGFQDKLTVDFGHGISTRVIGEISPTSFTVEAHVATWAAAGIRDVVVVNPDCSTAICPGAVNVAPTPVTPRLTPQRPEREAPARVVAEERPRSRRRPT